MTIKLAETIWRFVNGFYSIQTKWERKTNTRLLLPALDLAELLEQDFGAWCLVAHLLELLLGIVEQQFDAFLVAVVA